MTFYFVFTQVPEKQNIAKEFIFDNAMICILRSYSTVTDLAKLRG